MKLLAALVVLTWCIGCNPHRPEPDMGFCVPAGTLALASIDLDRVRAAPIYRKLPPEAGALAESYHSTRRLLAAWNGTDVLMIVRGTAPGTTPIAPDLALGGSTESVRAGAAQYRTGRTSVPGLLDYATRTAGQRAVWITAQGGVSLPLTGNARNLNRLLENLDYITLSADLTAAIDLHVTALGRSEAAARAFEENLRGFLSLASAAQRRPEVRTLFDSVQIHRDGATAEASLRVPANAIESLVAPFLR